MPWDADDSTKHTKKAKSPTAKRQWAKVANGVLAKTGDEGRAIRAADSVVRKRGEKPPKTASMRKDEKRTSVTVRDSKGKAVAKASGLKGEAAKEHKEHPWTTPAQAKRIAADHQRERRKK